MTSQERVLASLNHQQPDRVPIDLSGHRSSGISAIAYPKLRAALGLEPRTVDVYDPVQQLAIVHEDVLDRLGMDTIELGRGLLPRRQVVGRLDPARWNALQHAGLGAAGAHADRGWVMRSPSGRIMARMPEGSLALRSGLLAIPRRRGGSLAHRRALSRAHVDRHTPRRRGHPSPARKNWPPARARSARQHDRAIIGLFGGNLLEMGQFYYRMDNFLMMLADEPRARPPLPRCPGGNPHAQPRDDSSARSATYIDVIIFGDDLGAQNSPQISPRMYREFFKPRQP